MLRQFSRGANVIEVAMRQQDLHQRDASLRHHRFDTFSIAARIDQRRQPGLPAPDKRTVLRERGNRNNTIVHDAPSLPVPYGTGINMHKVTTWVISYTTCAHR